MSIKPGGLGVPTERDIELAWKATEKPSQRTVEKAMRAAGWEVSGSTIMRVKASGFKPRSVTPGRGRRSKAKISQEETAIKQVKAVAPPDAPAGAVADALLEAIRNLPPGAKDRVKELLEMDEQQLENATNKLVKVARHLLAEDLAQHTKLMMLAPDKAAKLYQALGSGLAPVMQPPNPGDGTDAKIVEHNPNEPRRLSPSAQAIADFRSSRERAA